MIFLTLITTLIAPAAHAECIAPREFVAHSHSGMYHRVHPSGNYVMYTGSGVQIADITDHANPKTVNSKMRAETYPVESATGGWELLASPYDSGGMNYYQMKDVLEKNTAADSVYKDPQNDQYYHSTAELPGSTDRVKKIRTLLYGQKYREYTMTKDARGNFTQFEPGPANQTLCQSFVESDSAAPDRSLTAEDTRLLAEARTRTAALNIQQEKISDRARAIENQLYNSRTGRDIKMSTAKRRALRAQQNAISNESDRLYSQMRPFQETIERLQFGSRYAVLTARRNTLQTEYYRATSEDARNAARNEIQQISNEMNRYNSSSRGFSNPVLSKDGTMVAAAGSNTIIVYKIRDGGAVCEKVGETGFSGSKVSFSYPEAGKLPKITFTGSGGPSSANGSGVYQYDLETKEAKFLGERGEGASYPGFTKDGRVIYYNRTGNNNGGFTIVDPNQVGGTHASTCIRKAGTSAPAEGNSGAAGSAE